MLLLATLASWAGFLLLVQPVLASEGSEDKWGAWLTIGRFFNLAEAQRARQEAEAKLSEMEMRMNRLNEEIEAIKLEAEIDARAEHDRLVAAAERDAAKIVERARQEIDGMTRAAHLELKSYVAELSVKMAEEKIRSEITGTDQSRLFSDFIGDLGGKA
jgi:F-type H+-transporting ATPase subunit b